MNVLKCLSGRKSGSYILWLSGLDLHGPTHMNVFVTDFTIDNVVDPRAGIFKWNCDHFL